MSEKWFVCESAEFADFMATMAPCLKNIQMWH